MLSTWDIIAENFGFMLTWGDLVYLPYLYGIGGWLLATKNTSSEWNYLICIIVFHICVHYMYRTANW
jgi:delta14-sterol reductase